MANSKLVYSTAGDNRCSRCGKPLKNCRCTDSGSSQEISDGFVRIRREKKGRGGKEVTVISGLGLDTDALKKLAKQLKTTCGTGGSVKDTTIELQGDKTAQAQAALEKQGYKVKRAGG
jgi:translation initiation factor 1